MGLMSGARSVSGCVRPTSCACAAAARGRGTGGGCKGVGPAAVLGPAQEGEQGGGRGWARKKGCKPK